MAGSNDGSPSQVVSLGGGPTAAETSAAPASSPRGFLKSLEGAFGRLVTLKIVTVVGEVSVGGGDGGAGDGTSVTARPGAAVEAASTEVNLLDGHILNVFSPGFAATGGALQSFHQSQVEKSGEIVLRNLAELQKLAGALATLRR